ncbi:MAG TPA: transcription-repair coupling factor [Steroidobacteraceae bacterium]|nr:transcription-repair coupling factor [Steroidobacteraceae bacterium]
MISQDHLPTAARPTVRWMGLGGAAVALALAEAAARLRGPLLVLTSEAAGAAQLEEELRFFAEPGLPILAFPGYETLPYDQFSPHPDIISQRLRSLARLPQLGRGIVLTDLATALQRLPPRSFIDGHALSLRLGEELDLEAFRLRLTAAGYASMPQVGEPGEFAIRGSLFDIFPMGSEAPLRIDLFDRQIDSIRSFDPETQRSSEKLERLDLLPAREFSLAPDSIRDFRRRFRTRFEGDLTRMPLYRDVGEGLAPAGIEYYLPLFFEATASLFDYLPASAAVALPSGHAAALEAAWATVEERHEERRYDIEHPVLAPAEIVVPPAEWLERARARPCVMLGAAAPGEPEVGVACTDLASAEPPPVRLDQRRPEAVQAFAQALAASPTRVLLAAESAGRRELLGELLRPHGVSPRVVAGWAEFLAGSDPVAITVAPLSSGVVLASPPATIYAEEQLFGDRARQERRRRRSERDPARIIQQLADLRPGAPVVHEDYGVGRYLGLTTMEAGGMPAEFLVLEYAGGDKLYVPVQALERISRYTGAPAETAPLHRLGSEQWSKARARAAARIRDAAAELLDVYARRAARQGHAFTVEESALRAFEAGFPFEETADQAAAIASVIDDLRAARPMDRVVCGDVGFGKTEVALRAAFVAVQGGRQVAVLVPTTLLAQQHYQTFADRFADWPVRIEMLSRFRAGPQAKTALEALAAGRVDVVVGTHRLLQPGVKFKNLGLVIIDEEHRFGVRDKERLKALRAEVDVLTLTATPIPRTLNMALGGLRELSLITTPPAARLSIKTFVSEWNAPTIREACIRELRRGGQVYYVHNSVETIEHTAQMLRELIPEARIAIGHGQMRERDLEQVMLDFYHKRANVLLCTTIIESGIDVPTANTIIIDRADRFGLAQLHQLRGRVGRSHHQAYAYLITPPQNAMTDDAKKRLEAIESLEDLGAGFVLATHDLEIRGAGELLGEEQSGQIQEIGFALYMELLERAVKALREGRTAELEKPLHHGPEIDLHVPSLLPEQYLPDVHARLMLYKRVSGVESATELDDLLAETTDRFGALPEPARHLFRIARLRLTAARAGVERLDVGPGSGSVTFIDNPPVDTGALLLFVQKQGRAMRFDGPRKLRFTGHHEEIEQRFAAAEGLLAGLAATVPA